ncbi:long-chain-acyl-CoA dehydrogenase [Jatrophihabitans sp. GAS493]|nr:acyl-CoA dehydrogenase family protein [Jatrophihabitans sp. GAS493]SOD73418.1 long-chain-acyl-CoA dehydrogenase [Jatrophihabitans sp. GAS493]
MPLSRTIFSEEHEAFRDSCRAFVAKHVTPNNKRWAEAGQVDRELWLEAGQQGLLGTAIDEEYGGGGVKDFRFNVILDEELAAAHAAGPGFPVHNDLIVPYLERLATPEQKKRWFPGMCSGELIAAIAMTEPGTGSDLQSIRTTAVRDGDHYVLNGQKTFISNGIMADIVIVAAKTGNAEGGEGLSLIVVERDTPGFERGRNLDKIGLKAQDTAELYFTDARVPAENLLGEEGKGFIYLIQNLVRERMTIAVVAVTAAETALDLTMKYCKERTAFGKPIGSFQHNRFLLAELATEVQIARTFVDRCIMDHVEETLDIPTAAMAKWWTTELQNKVVDRCLQLHGGYGFMSEYPISQAFLDSRVQTIYGGTTEIMKEIIGRSLGF